MGGRAIAVHSLDQARAALGAAEALGVPVTLVSAEAAAGSAGVLWFRELVALAREAHPGAEAEALLDCGEQPGHVLAALRHGFTRLRFKGTPAQTRKLRAIAGQYGATLISRRPKALDLLDEADPAAACRAWLTR